MIQKNKFRGETLKNKIEPYVYLFPFMFFLIIFTIYPIINVFILSFKENYSHLRGTYDGFNFSNYKEVLSDEKFRQAIANTFLYVLCVVPASVVIATFTAYLLNKKIKGIQIFQTAFFMPMVTSITAVGLIWRFMYNQKYGVFNYFLSLFGIEKIGWLTDSKWTLFSLAIFGIWNVLPFTIILLLSGFQNIDEIYYTVAKVDGAKNAKIFFRIVVPLLSPTIFLVSIINTISSFKVFSELYPLFNGKPGPYYNFYTVVYYIRYAMVEKRKYGYASAAAVILFFCIMIFTFLELFLKKINGKKTR